MSMNMMVFSEITAKICGVPEKLVKIWFDDRNGVSWFAMPSLLHKIIVHGREINETCPLPISLTSEEASKANNKFLRKFRLHHIQKKSWKDGMQVN